MQIQKQKAISKGFTLIELMLTIAIISILAVAILVALSSQREKARNSKVLMELSATLQPMMMCWSDGEDVAIPGVGGGGNICSGEPSYGTWPVISSSSWSFTTRSISNDGTHVYTLVASSGSSSITCSSTNDSCIEN